MVFGQVPGWNCASRALFLWLALVVSGCATLRIERPGEYPPQPPLPPAVPDAVADDVPETEPHSHEVSARPPPNLRNQLVVVSGRPAAVRVLFEVLPRALVGAGDPSALHATHILGGRWPFEHAAPAGDYLVFIDNVTITQRDVAVRYHVPSEALAQYTRAHRAFVHSLQAYRSALSDGSDDYVRRFRAEVARLELRAQRLQTAGALAAQAGAGAASLGTYERIAADVSRLSPSDQETLIAAQEWVNAVAQYAGQAAALAQAVPAPEAIVTRAAARPEAHAGVMYTVNLRALLTDLRSGETFWLTDISAEGRTRTQALERAAGVLIQLRWRGGRSTADAQSARPAGVTQRTEASPRPAVNAGSRAPRAPTAAPRGRRP